MRWDLRLWFLKENGAKEWMWAELNKPVPILNDTKNRNCLKCCSDIKSSTESETRKPRYQTNLLWGKMKCCPWSEVAAFWLLCDQAHSLCLHSKAYKIKSKKKQTQKSSNVILQQRSTENGMMWVLVSCCIKCWIARNGSIYDQFTRCCKRGWWDTLEKKWPLLFLSLLHDIALKYCTIKPTISSGYREGLGEEKN